MLAKRIIPCLDVRDGRVVKGVNFVNIRDAGDPVELAPVLLGPGGGRDRLSGHHRYQRRPGHSGGRGGADCGAGVRPPDRGRRHPHPGGLPAAPPGGCGQDLREFRRGEGPGADLPAAERFGSQCVVLAIDARRRPEGSYEVVVAGGRTPTGLDAVEWARRGEALGAGEILLTSMDADGTKAGFDLEMTRAVTQAVSIPVIASGGCGSLEHFAQVFAETDCDAALAASLFHFGELTVPQVKEYLRKRKIPVR